LKLCAQKSELSEVESKYFLSQIYSIYLNENEEAEKYLKELTNRFNSNSLFLYSLASVKIKLRKIDEAQVLLDRVIEISNSKFKSVKNLAYFLKGDCYFYNNQFNLAKPFYQKFLKEHNDIDYKPTASYRLGLCYELTNQHELAKVYFEKVTTFNCSTEDDVYSKRKAEECLRKSLNAEELNLIYNINLFKSGKLDIAQRNLEEILKLNKGNEIRPQIFFQLGLIHFEKMQFENAKTYFNNVINSNLKSELWLIPFSNYYLAKIFSIEGDKIKAQRNLDKIYSFQDFDFEKMLKIWVESLRFKIS
ncbi:MAG: DUF3808 domain-containing protein, partial [Ignavibacteria bacterium]|nr:DUF3808 domain-containing protein [Ignavibacteria bacterium]